MDGWNHSATLLFLLPSLLHLSCFSVSLSLLVSLTQYIIQSPFLFLPNPHPPCLFLPLSLSLSHAYLSANCLFQSFIGAATRCPFSLSLALFLPLSLPLLDIITGASHAPTFQPANEITEPPSVHSHITHTPNTHTPSHIYVHTYAKMPVEVWGGDTVERKLNATEEYGERWHWLDR